MNQKAILGILVLLLGGALTAGAQPPASPVTNLDGTITFNCSTHDVGAQPDKYKVPAGHELKLTLTLVTQGNCTGTAAFATPPTTFPHGDPPDFQWEKESDTEVMLREINDNAGSDDEEYFFKARVTYGGETHQSPDPTIINQGQG